MSVSGHTDAAPLGFCIYQSDDLIQERLLCSEILLDVYFDRRKLNPADLPVTNPVEDDW